MVGENTQFSSRIKYIIANGKLLNESGYLPNEKDLKESIDDTFKAEKNTISEIMNLLKND